VSGQLVISSGVHLGVQDNDPISQAWFDAAPTVQFSPVTLSSVAAPRTGGQQISGHAALFDAPVEFTFERRTRDVLTTSLASIAVKALLNGGTRRTLSGFQDAVALDGRLCKFVWSERNNATPGSANEFEVWGVFRITSAVVAGTRERMVIQVFPCSILYYTGTDSVAITPSEYDALDDEE